jgi:hypothetical protein
MEALAIEIVVRRIVLTGVQSKLSLGDYILKTPSPDYPKKERQGLGYSLVTKGFKKSRDNFDKIVRYAY